MTSLCILRAMRMSWSLGDGLGLKCVRKRLRLPRLLLSTLTTCPIDRETAISNASPEASVRQHPLVF